MTLYVGWGESERLHVQNTEKLHEISIIRTRLRLQATEYWWHKKYNHMHNTGIVSQVTAVQQVHHTWSIWMCCTLAAHHGLCRKHGTRCSLHQDVTDRWSTFAIIFDITEWLQHRNCESGNNTSNCTVEEVGCSWFMSSPSRR